MKQWKCHVCGYVHKGNAPPKKCPSCGSGSGEYSEVKGAKEKLKHNGKKFDVLLINGSSHRAHNTARLADITEAELKKRGVSYRRFDLNSLEIQHCWCCYSMGDAECTYPCRNQFDDMPALHEMIVDSKTVIIASPINWNNMSARLKDFLDRLTCIQNMPLLKKGSLTTGKTLGILIDGHEDGAVKTAMDIFIYFQQMGYILAPFGMAYRTHGSAFPAETDFGFFRADAKVKQDVNGTVNNVIETMNLDAEKRLKGKIDLVCQ